ncbi:hypothetical protein ACO0K9_20390 [Undibacterium sp. Ji50W]|uniref:hypothetical protein n=1 Tax=Undibacterium sp. Ji50W TaxID=3413041 RepID=UPI003BF150EB
MNHAKVPQVVACPCAASAAMEVGKSDGPWYSTLMPSEHYDSMRRSQFPNTCNTQQLTDSSNIQVSTRRSGASYLNPYNIVTRQRDELFVYGGYVGEGDGAYVAKINPTDLSEQWRICLKVKRENYFDWPGALGVHGNGYLYAIAGNIIAKVDAETAKFEQARLPEHPGQGGAAYNGFVISREGILMAKSIERGTTEVNSILGLRAAVKNAIPSFLVAIDPDDLRILAQIETPETVIGRVSMGQHDGVEYVYCPGTTKIWRYRYAGNQFLLDESWQPTYVQDGEMPGTACALMNDWVIVQTNFLESSQPLRISAFHVQDSQRSHSVQPFPGAAPSQEFSKPGVDAENGRIYTNDQLVGKVAGLDFDAESGFNISWQAEQRMASFWAITGPQSLRNIIGTNFSAAGDHVLWRDAKSGEQLAASDALDSKFNGNIVSSGFAGKFYYLGVASQQIIEMTLVPD